MTKDPVQIYCERSWQRNAIELFLVATNEDGTKAAGQPIKMEALPDGGTVSAPTLRLRMTQAQQLMDELWRCGIRPTEGTGSAGALAATERHLADMQRLTFTLLRDEQSVADHARGHGFVVESRP